MLSVFFFSTIWAAFTTGEKNEKAGGLAIFAKKDIGSSYSFHVTDFFRDVGDLSVLMDTAHIASIAYTGLITSAFAVVLESIALAFVSAEETSIIFR